MKLFLGESHSLLWCLCDERKLSVEGQKGLTIIHINMQLDHVASELTKCKMTRITKACCQLYNQRVHNNEFSHIDFHSFIDADAKVHFERC